MALAQLEEWSLKEGLTLSPEKSTALCCHKTKNWINLPHLHLFNRNIPWSEKTKYLGFTIQRNLKWIDHIDDSCAKAFKGINVIRSLTRTWWGSHPSTLLILYKSIVRSHLDYGSIFYARCSKNVLRKLDVVQYAALRSALGYMKSTPTNIILSASGESPLYHRRN